MSDLQRAAISLRTVRTHLVDMRMCIENNVARVRYWSVLPLPPEALAVRDELARAERAERTELALGESEAPVDVHLLDVEATVITGLLCAEAMVRNEVGLAPRRRARDEAGSAALALERALDQLSPAMVTHLAYQSAGWARLLSEALGLSMRPITIKSVCPWCRGVDTLRLFPVDADPYVACTSGVCEPGQAAERWIGARPAWGMRWWSWLADQLNEAA